MYSPLKSVRWSGSLLCLLLICNPTLAEIIPDTTLTNNSIVESSGDIRVIEGGTQRGENLFHSFREFSFSTFTRESTGDTALFNNDLAVKNIITRVTGSSPTNIDGILRARGTANLFFINPHGIIFGANASLDIGGSFVASTANSVKFADGAEFSATPSGTTPLLTVNVPIGLQFGSDSGEIINQSQASIDEAVNSLGLPPGLQVRNGRTLALLGGNVSLQGGNLTTIGGRIELGSVAANSFVKLNEIDTGYALGYEDVENFADIQLTDRTFVDASDSFDVAIQVQARNITLSDSSVIFAIASGSTTSGNLVINAVESVKLSDGSNIITLAEGEAKTGDVIVKAGNFIELVGTSESLTTIASQVCVLSLNCENVTGSAGNLTIESRQLLIRDGAAIEASTFGAGRAGNVLIIASDSIELIGTSSNGEFRSGIFAQVAQGSIDNPGDAGTLTIETKRLTVQGGAQISTAARNSGNGGNLTINASDTIQLSGTSLFATASFQDTNRSGIFVSAESEATGNVGNLNITTGLLTVENGARISADNFGSGQKTGNATFNLRQLVIQNGGEVRAGSFSEGPGGTLTINAIESVDVVGTGVIAGETIPSTLFSQALEDGNAGNLIINTPILNVGNGGEVTVSATGTGAAGNLTANANTIRLSQGKLTAETNAGEGANIRLENLQLLTLQNQSLISAQAFNQANGGNITINAPEGFIIAFPNQNNDIVANAFQGRGGNINITARNIFNLTEQQSTPPNNTNDIDASSQFGLTGSIIINTPDVDPSRGLVQLPENVTDASQQIVSSCNPGSLASRSSFTVTGRGGIARSPIEPLQAEMSRARWITLDTANERQSSNINFQSPTPEIVEAQGWIMDKNGTVSLVAQVPNITPHGSIASNICPVK
ncbi:filamentous hemagglutinin [Nostoc minutum NIES-26]|uniref:Filamentous hemagglutinin n=1 Tax=Nostoc minutum NIES-26 TaxID=1844469 RepID=A0A367QSK0_9NOSO|nr:filamentous hemagglutinin [Nostoc minutum NIES-26]